MPVYRMTLAYDGTAYCGWQVQPNQRTIQGVLEEALYRITGTSSRIVASGRTDAGVHALRQVAGFRTTSRLRPEVLCRAINANTPADIHVWEMSEASEQFHAIRDAVSKRYRYTIQDGPHRDVFARRYAWHVARNLDDQTMRAAAQTLVGRHDFHSFEASGSPRKTTVRTVHELVVRRRPGQVTPRIELEIEADGFLYNMVRNIVGTLVLIGRGDRPASWLDRVLAACDRKQAGPTAPAHGLTLCEVRY